MAIAFCHRGHRKDAGSPPLCRIERDMLCRLPVSLFQHPVQQPEHLTFLFRPHQILHRPQPVCSIAASGFTVPAKNASAIPGFFSFSCQQPLGCLLRTHDRSKRQISYLRMSASSSCNWVKRITLHGLLNEDPDSAESIGHFFLRPSHSPSHSNMQHSISLSSAYSTLLFYYKSRIIFRQISSKFRPISCISSKFKICKKYLSIFTREFCCWERVCYNKDILNGFDTFCWKKEESLGSCAPR